MSEHSIASDSSISIDTATLLGRFLRGGEDSKTDTHGGDFPNGGFLPIFLCKKKDIKEKESENRQFKTRDSKTSISIKDILTKRKNRT